jgi:hypothetical protein
MLNSKIVNITLCNDEPKNDNKTIECVELDKLQVEIGLDDSSRVINFKRKMNKILN